MREMAASRATLAAVEPPLLAGLMRGELVEWTQQLQATFERLERMRAEGLMPTTLAGTQVFADAVRQTAGLVDKIDALTQLADAFSHGLEGNRERVFLYTMLKEAVGDTATVHSTRIVVREPDLNVAPVYGNKRLLAMLLTHLLRELDASTPAEHKIILTLRQLGNHMFLASQTEALTLAEQRRKSQPLSLAAEGLTFSLCRRIAELHGGTLRLASEHGGKGTALMNFTLSLPTSVPTDAQNERSCADCPLTGQIERYAADLAEMIDRCHHLESERTRDGQAPDRR